MSETRDFWLSCGHHLTDRSTGGGLLVSDEFLKAYLARPEIAPPQDACLAERRLHATLLADPRRPVQSSEIAEFADADARENWQLMIAFRDHLMGHATLEAAYLDLVRRGITFPHVFLNQLVHVVLRNALDGCRDPFVLRAAELFFRPQKMALHDGSLLAVDEEILSGIGARPLSPLVSMLGLPVEAQIDVINEENNEAYWARSDLFDMALDLTAGRRGLEAVGQVIKAWIAHLLAVEVEVEPLTATGNVSLAWYVGLDADGTRIGNALWNGEDVSEGMQSAIVGLFRLAFRDPGLVIDKVKDDPVYVILAMNTNKVLRIKPQNLVVGLPIWHLEAAT